MQRPAVENGEPTHTHTKSTHINLAHLLATTVHTTHVQPHISLGGKRWARRGGMAMVQDTQGKRWKRPQVSRILARPTRVLWQEALLTDVCWRDVCPRWRQSIPMRAWKDTFNGVITPQRAQGQRCQPSCCTHVRARAITGGVTHAVFVTHTHDGVPLTPKTRRAHLGGLSFGLSAW